MVFCPDAIGTDVVRSAPIRRRAPFGFPNFASPARIDWVDYDGAGATRSTAGQFAGPVLRLAGDHTIWFVYTNNGTLVDQKCAKIADVLSLRPTGPCS